ncbi:MAG TPA: GH92 family glycosyl hydrolase [Prolixibacteraceae bacterium]|nr:GH92 family glycosyl hydrolase [Prolixibacteraceae bacterium]
MRIAVKILPLLMGTFLFNTSCLGVKIGNKEPIEYVNPYIGNISHLLVPTFPTIHLPNSMLRVYPQRSDFTGSLLRGLPIVLTSHRGSFAFNLSPFQGDSAQIQRVIPYSYDLEKITPYSYSVMLDQQNIAVNFALSHQSALYDLKFEPGKPVGLVINSSNGEMNWDGKALSGFEVLQNNTKVYIWFETDVKPQSVGALKNGKIETGFTKEAQNSAAIVLNFGSSVTRVRARYGISFIDEMQAKKNLAREIKTFEVKPLLEEGRRLWNESLGKTTVTGGSEDDKAVFYTCLYRTYERPVCISEDGRYYSPFDGKVHNDSGVPSYTDDWSWDTYRASHPLRVLTEPKMEVNILNSFIRMAEQSGNFQMPTFPGITGDSHAMNCNHAVAMVIDAYEKGLRGFELEKAYKACKASITEKTLIPWSGKSIGELDRFYIEKGYFPALREGEPETIAEVHTFEKRQAVAVTLGTSYDQWCLSQIARRLGKTEDYRYFLKCSYNYRNLFNPKTGFFHPKDSKGEFIFPFNYVSSGGIGGRDYYDENNGWTYRWDVQHNVGDLIELMGGKEAFVAGMDAMFSESLGKDKWQFYSQFPDQTGNVGQYSMANEPSFHIPYLYNYAAQPWKTQKSIRSLLKMWYRNDLMGVPGDEDGGGMSAFVVFSKLGFYPVTPGSPTYNIGSPIFNESVIKMGNGKEFKIISKNVSEENKYIQSAKLNGTNWNKPWFRHDDIKDGAVLELEMGNKANKSWGSSPDAVPPSAEHID